MRWEAMRGSTSIGLQRTLAWAARAAASTWEAMVSAWEALPSRLGRSVTLRGDSSGATTIAVTDGGTEEFPDAGDPEETAFIWGQTRDDPNLHGPGANGSPEAEFEAIDDRLDDLAERADHLSILATNANLKLARDEPGDLAGIAYDVEAEVRGLHRAIEALESRVDRLRDQFQDSPSERPGGDEPDRTERARPRAASQDRTIGGRPSVQFPGGDRHLSGPWRTAGVDLTNWPGHLARLEFEQIQKQVTPSETVATGRVPPDVAEFSLDDGELSFEALLSLATASRRGRQTANDGTAPDEEDEAGTDGTRHTGSVRGGEHGDANH